MSEQPHPRQVVVAEERQQLRDLASGNTPTREADEPVAVQPQEQVMDTKPRPTPSPGRQQEVEERGGWLKPTAPPGPQATAPIGPFSRPGSHGAAGDKPKQ